MELSEFIARWTRQEGGAERANYALFLTELCEVLNLPRPDPAGVSTERNGYVFERFIRRPDGSNGRIDLYKRDAFVLEAKQSRQQVGGDKFVDAPAAQLDLMPGAAPERLGRRAARRGWDVLMLNARQQAEDYARHLPQDHGWPPFVIVCDVGHSFEVFADFRRMGKYEQFPDRQSFRIYLDDLRDPAVQARLRAIWTDPHSLDPSRQAARTTREIARRLAEVTKALEAKGAVAEDVAHFLMRCIFTMFAEDWKLLPEASFRGLLQRSVEDPANFPRRLKELWSAMDGGGFSHAIDADVRRFNGGLFKDTAVFDLGREEIGELLAAAKADWREVEPAIFGTLLEQALNPAERKKLGAHYTPRAYVERLVTATVIDPLRDDWRNVLATAEERRAAGDAAGAAEVVRAFHDTLCETRVLDPACGTGNFLYVALELMKRLEGEVLEALVDLGGQESLGLERHTVDPHQFLGLELNPRAAAIAELVLWIGYLQQHFRLKGAAPGDPILRAFNNINFGRPGGYDAVLTWDGWPTPKVVDGKETYPNARRPEWPEAEFIVGNPPFIGKGAAMREALTSTYVEALWDANGAINASADFVMYWWDRAAEILLRRGSSTRRFGLVTTNSITQEFNRRSVKRRLDGKPPASIYMAIPDHPWYRGADAAAVRIAMTVVGRGRHSGVLSEVTREANLDSDDPLIEFTSTSAVINCDLSVGSDVGATQKLSSNAFVASNGMLLAGRGFRVPPSSADALGAHSRNNALQHLRPYVGGSELITGRRRSLVIDFADSASEDVRRSFPEMYQHLLLTVKAERDKVATARGTPDSLEYARNWWKFAKVRQSLRHALSGIPRYIATTETTKHRFFQFLERDVVPDHMVVAIAMNDAAWLSVLSSRVHTTWALRAGGWLGVGNDPRYSKSKVFDPFPFPLLGADGGTELRSAGEELDAFRKARQAEHPNLTLTQMYNVREAIRAGRELTPDEARIKDEGLILILNELHDRIDRLTLQAYGWPEDLSDEEILERLVALNAERAAEERRGIVRWLRPDYQKARAGVVELRPETAEMDLAAAAPERAAKPAFPANAVEATGAVAAALFGAAAPLDAAAIAAGFKGGRRLEPRIAAILQALVRTGAAATRDAGRTFQARRAA